MTTTLRSPGGQRSLRRPAIAVAATVTVIAGLGLPAPVAHAESAAQLVAHYPLEESSGTRAADASGNGHHATLLGGAVPGGSAGVRLDGATGYVGLPDDLLRGLDSITVSTEVLIRPEQATPYFIYGLGNSSAGGAGNGYLFTSGDTYRSSITLTDWRGEQTANHGSALARGTWATLTYTLDDATDVATLYLDGAEVARSTDVTITPGSIGDGATTANAIGRSLYAADRHLAGSVRDLRIYDMALTAVEVQALMPSDAARADRDAAALDLGDTSEVRDDLALPSSLPNGSIATWSSSDARVVSETGGVTRPSAADGEAEVTLTATVTRGAAVQTRAFTVLVRAEDSAADRAAADLAAIEIPNAADVRGNIALPGTGSAHGSAIEWSAEPAGAVTTTVEDGRAPGVVTRTDEDVTVTLTARVPGTDAERRLDIVVRAAPVDLDDDYTAGYLWTHFGIEGGYEKIFFGHSQDGLHWSTLNDDQPILANLAGDLGVRDPHLVRAPEGDRYWIIGTDLHAEGGGPGGSGWNQLTASQDLVVWESNDLVTWTDQRLPFAGFEHAGNVWAPEAIYNDATGEYWVYWSARDRRHHETPDWALRVYLTKTRDFVEFSTPEVWLSLNEPGDGQGGPNIIDTTIAQEGDTYYRFSTSDWLTVLDTAPALEGPWTRVIDRGEAERHGLRARMEGLTVYPLPDDTWAVMGDEHRYYAHTAPTLAGLDFSQLRSDQGQFSFDRTFRHGSVLRLSAAEEQRLLAAYGDAPPEPEPEPEPNGRGLVAEYTFDDGTLADEVGDADLTASGSAAVVPEADRGQVLRLDGSAGGYAAFPVGFFDGAEQATISLDVRSELSDGNFFTFGIGQDSNRYYFLRARGGDVRSAITQGSWQGERAVTGGIRAGEWHSYDIVFDGRSMTVYVDGARLGTASELTTSLAELGTGLRGYLGRSFYSGDRAFQGSFDNVRVYDRALTAAEVLAERDREDLLAEVSLADPAVLRLDPIVDPVERTVTFPVGRGTDLTALAPTFTTAAGISATPASGTVLDLTGPQTVALSRDGDAVATWTLEAVVVTSPVLDGRTADPNIAVFGDTYYIYATSDGFPGWGGTEFFVWSSKDLVDWERSAEPFLTLDGANGDVPWAVGNAWAPTIIERDGRYYFYFSGHNAALNRKTMGVAVADHPEGPFTAEPTPMVINDPAVEPVISGQAIDPAAFHDPETGKYYLAWGNGGPENGPVIAELQDDMVSLKPETFRRIPGLTGFREGIFFNYRDGLYHLTYSIDDTGSENYRVGYASADSMEGPWTNHGVILEKDLSLGIKGPGHSSILNVPGTDDWYIVYHRFAIPDGNGWNRETTIDRLPIGPDGLFQRVTPTLESVGPQLVPAAPKVETTVATRCVAGRVSVVPRVVNLADAPVDVTLRSAYGERTFTRLAPTRGAAAAFSTRLATIPAGRLTVIVDGGAPSTVPIPAASCRSGGAVAPSS